MSTKVEIVADSINPKGRRLTTYILEYQRFVHAEMLTHRCFSKNAASSRAIPIEKMIQQIIDNPAMPVWWGKNQSGMQAKEELDDTQKIHRDPYCYGESYTEKELAKRLWIKSRDLAIDQVRQLSKLGLHKQVANRILEPWFNIRIILSGTDFDNFFALRAHPDAQPEIQELAYKMLEAYNASTPKTLEPGDWHIPFGDRIDTQRLIAAGPQNGPDHCDYDPVFGSGFNHACIKVAVARCARISFLNYEGRDDYAADIALCERLFGSSPRHLSPTEHVAQCLDSDERVGNLSGWKQYRYLFPDQNLSDSRVKKPVVSL